MCIAKINKSHVLRISACTVLLDKKIPVSVERWTAAVTKLSLDYSSGNISLSEINSDKPILSSDMISLSEINSDKLI